MNARLSALVATALFLSGNGCGRLPGKPGAADVDIKPRDVRDFALLYHENCAGCHGEDGRGNGALALANPVYLAIVSDDVLRHTTALGVRGTLMPPFAQSAGGMLNDEQINILVTGMRSRWARPGVLNGAEAPPYVALAPGDARRGADVFAAFCVSCHGPDGKGAPKIGSIVDASYLALVSDQNLRTTVIAGRPNLGHPDWRNCVINRPLTAAQVTDVVAWLAAHRTATPGQPYPTARVNPSP
jgi:mono/diheme cytochrome c family protein